MNPFQTAAMPPATHEALNLPPELQFRKPAHIQNREARQLRRTFSAYIQENFPKVCKIRCKIVPCTNYVLARARYKNRYIYAWAYTISDCIARFAKEYEMKVV
jgi:hypothetical protein